MSISPTLLMEYGTICLYLNCWPINGFCSESGVKFPFAAFYPVAFVSIFRNHPVVIALREPVQQYLMHLLCR